MTAPAKALSRSRLARLHGTLGLVLLAGFDPGSKARAATDVEHAVHAIVTAHAAADAPDELRSQEARRLAALGSEALPVVVAALFEGRIGLEDDAEILSIDPAVEALLVEALREWPARTVLACVVARAERADRLDERVVALRLVGQLADLGTMDSIFEVVAGIDREGLQHSVVTKELEGALTSVLARDAEIFSFLEDEYDRFDPVLFPSLAMVVGETGDGAGIDLLEKLMGLSSELDVRVLDALGRIAPWDPANLDGSVARSVYMHLSARDARVQKQAAISVGRLRDVDAFTELVTLLGATDSRVRNGALWALREISGLSWPAEPGRWKAYHEQESAWIAIEAPELVRRALGDDVASAVDALRQVSSHVLFRRHLAEEVVHALDHREETVVLAACTALARLDDPIAVEPLIAMLTDSHQAVRERAHAALQAITDEQLPLDPGAWTDRLSL